MVLPGDQMLNSIILATLELNTNWISQRQAFKYCLGIEF